MSVYIYSIAVFIVGLIVGIAIDRLKVHRERKISQWEPVNPIPDAIIKIESDEKNYLDMRLVEWHTVIETQMHFNDLIIKFRSITLTAFVALVGSVVTIARLLSLSFSTFLALLTLPIGFWLSAYMLDFFYYHRLLLGAVAQARKFDKWKFAEKTGFFGLTKCIGKNIKVPTSNVLLNIYYFFPLSAFLAVLFAWYLFLR